MTVLRWPRLCVCGGSGEGEDLGGKELEATEKIFGGGAQLPLRGEVELADRTLLVPSKLLEEFLRPTAEVVTRAIDHGLDGLAIRTMNAQGDISHGAHWPSP